MIRLDKYLADTGAASRREAKAYIRRGEVTVDGVTARAPEQKVAETAVVCLRGQPLRYQAYHYYMLHKPAAFSPRRPTAVSRRCWICSRRSCGASGSCPPGGSIGHDRPAAHHGRWRLCPPRHHAEKARSEGLFRAHGRPAHKRGCGSFAQGVVLGDGTQCLPPGSSFAGAGGLPRHGL